MGTPGAPLLFRIAPSRCIRKNEANCVLLLYVRNGTCWKSKLYFNQPSMTETMLTWHNGYECGRGCGCAERTHLCVFYQSAAFCEDLVFRRVFHFAADTYLQ